MSTIILKSVPEQLLDGLPHEDQVAIRAAVGQPVTLVGHNNEGRAEIEFRDAAGDLHTIWVDPASLDKGVERMTIVCPLCDEPTDGPCGDMECPLLDRSMEDPGPIIPAHWTVERRLRSAICILEGACDSALRLATMSEETRASIQDAIDYAKVCKT